MPTINDLRDAIAKIADTPKSKINATEVQRVLACMGDAIADNPELEPVLQRILVNARKRKAKQEGAK